MIGKPIYPASTTPKLAPIANNGVTSPPLKPIAVQRAVNISFNIKSNLSIISLRKSDLNPEEYNLPNLPAEDIWIELDRDINIISIDD